MPDLLLIIGKTCLLFFLTLLCFRLMGYRTLGDMEPLDYVIVLGVGEIMGSPLSNPRDSVWPAAGAIITLTLLQIALSALFAHVPKIGQMLEGKPIPVIKDGVILHSNLRKNRLTTASIREELRIKGIRDETDVDRAYLEPSGRFSVLLKNEASPLTPRYIGGKPSLILAERGEIRPEQWTAAAPFTKGDILAFLRQQNIKNWAEVDTLLWKNGSFILTTKEPTQQENTK